MSCMNHKIKVVEHLHIGHHNWIEDVTVQQEIKAAKELVQQVLNRVSALVDPKTTILVSFMSCKKLKLNTSFNLLESLV